MKRLLWLLPLLFVAVISAAPRHSRRRARPRSPRSSRRRPIAVTFPASSSPSSNKDGVLYNEAFGQSSTLTNTPMTKDTIFNMASMTKPVTSVAIMMLVDEGKLKLDDDVAKYLPKCKDPAGHQQVQRGRRQLRDASGQAPDHHPPSADAHVRHRLRVREPDADEDHGRRPSKTEMDSPLLFDPGESWAYGASTRVLGIVVEVDFGTEARRVPRSRASSDRSACTTRAIWCRRRSIRASSR